MSLAIDSLREFSPWLQDSGQGKAALTEGEEGISLCPQQPESAVKYPHEGQGRFFERKLLEKLCAERWNSSQPLATVLK